MSSRPIVPYSQSSPVLNQKKPQKPEEELVNEPKFFLHNAIHNQRLNSPEHTGKTEITRKFYSVLAGHLTQNRESDLLPLNFYKLSQNHDFRKDYLQYCLFGFIRDEAGNNVTNLFFDKFDEKFCSILKLIPARKNEHLDASRFFFGFNKSLFTNRTKEFLNVVYGGNETLFKKDFHELMHFEVRGRKLKDNSYLSNLEENFEPFHFKDISLHRAWFEQKSDPQYKNSVDDYKKAIQNSEKCFSPQKLQPKPEEKINKFSAEVEEQCEKFEKKFMPEYVKNMKENFLKNMAEYVNSNFFDFLKMKEDNIRHLKNNVNFFNKYFNLISYLKENKINFEHLKDENFILTIPNSILPLTSLKNKKEFIKTFLLLQTNFIETYDKVDFYFKEKLYNLQKMKSLLEEEKGDDINAIQIQLVIFNIKCIENVLNDKSQYFDNFLSCSSDDLLEYKENINSHLTKIQEVQFNLLNTNIQGVFKEIIKTEYNKLKPSSFKVKKDEIYEKFVYKVTDIIQDSIHHLSLNLFRITKKTTINEHKLPENDSTDPFSEYINNYIKSSVEIIKNISTATNNINNINSVMKKMCSEYPIIEKLAPMTLKIGSEGVSSVLYNEEMKTRFIVRKPMWLAVHENIFYTFCQIYVEKAHIIENEPREFYLYLKEMIQIISPNLKETEKHSRLTELREIISKMKNYCHSFSEIKNLQDNKENIRSNLNGLKFDTAMNSLASEKRETKKEIYSAFQNARNKISEIERAVQLIAPIFNASSTIITDIDANLLEKIDNFIEYFKHYIQKTDPHFVGTIRAERELITAKLEAVNKTINLAKENSISIPVSLSNSMDIWNAKNISFNEEELIENVLMKCLNLNLTKEQSWSEYLFGAEDSTQAKKENSPLEKIKNEVSSRIETMIFPKEIEAEIRKLAEQIN